MGQKNGMTPRHVIIRRAIHDECCRRTGRKTVPYNLSSEDDRNLMRAVDRYRKFHKTELDGFVKKRQDRERHRVLCRAAESCWRGNVLGCGIYKAYREALATNKFSHLRVRRKMISIDRSNIIATCPMDYKVLSILRHRSVDNEPGPWY